MKKVVIIFSFLLSIFQLFGQEDTAKDSVKLGDKYYKNGYYKKALDPYLYAVQYLGDDADLNFKIGHSYLNSPVKSKARPYLQKAYELNKKVDEDVVYELARSYQFELNFDKAIEYFQMSKEAGNSKASENITQCGLAKQLSNDPVNVTIENLGENVNSAYGDYACVVTSDGNNLYFTSRRPDNVGGNRDVKLDVWMEDIYYSHKDSNNVWSKAVNLGLPVNTTMHDASVNISGDGQTLFSYRDENENGGDVYVSYLQGDKWSKPASLGDNINTKHQEVSASLSPDGNTLYVVSNKPGGLGGKDIYTSKKDESGNWEELANIGSTINTKGEEDCVFMHSDGKTLYFSSTGHNSIGGYDIFKSELVNGIWSEPKNIGVPVNTPDNDVFFVLAADGKSAFYSSGKIGGFGEKDIYTITFHEEEKNLTLFKGIVMNEAGEKLAGQIEITIMKSGVLFNKMESNSKTGEFTLSLPNGEDYEILVGYKDLIPYKGEILLKDKKGYHEMEKDIVLLKGNKDAKLDYVYTIQVATRIEKETAEKIKKNMVSNGVQDVYVQKVVFTDTEQQLYRVRIGRFDTLEEGMVEGNKIPKALLPDGNFWVDNVREENYYVAKKEYDILEE